MIVTGVVLVATGLATRRLLPLEPVWLALEGPLVLAGAILALGAGLVGRRISERTAVGCSLAIWTLLLAAGLLEAGCRWTGLDLLGEEAAQRRMPPYYREPRQPSGSVFFRRHGPEAWHGPPIRTRLELEGLAAQETYRDEPAITVRYDALGFRDDDVGDDWEIVVAGDSFVELGCLAHADLFTTLLGRSLGERVRNLGASNTGPLTHLHYLEDFGLAPTLKQAVVVFYEGNDLQDLGWEQRALAFHARTGKRGYRNLRRQTSPLGALYEFWFRPPPRRGAADLAIPVHQFQGRDGPQPVTLPPFAPDPSLLEPALVQAWEDFLRRYRAFGSRHGVEVWLAYMPCKARVLHGMVQPLATDEEAQAAWIPTPLPDWIADGCRRHGIRFIDVTPALRRSAVEDRTNPYNGMVDTHLNALGSALVARELAAHLGGDAPPIHPPAPGGPEASRR